MINKDKPQPSARNQSRKETKARRSSMVIKVLSWQDDNLYENRTSF